MSIWNLIIGMALITAIRYSLLPFPICVFPLIRCWGLHYVPGAVLAAIVLPGIFMPDGQHWQIAWITLICWQGGVHPDRRYDPSSAGDNWRGDTDFFLLRWVLGALPL